jgi:hypothetical protein
MTVREAGQRGGRKTAETHPHEHYQAIGHKGGSETLRRHGPEHYKRAGLLGAARVRELIAAGKKASRAK